MSLYLNALNDSIRAGIVAAIPALLPVNGGGGVFELEHMEVVNYAETMQSTSLYASFKASVGRRTEAAPVACRYYSADIEINLIADVDSNSEGLRPYLDALRDYLYGHDFTIAQVVSVGQIDTSDNAGANFLFIEKGYSQRCGTVRVEIVYGDGPGGGGDAAIGTP